MTPAATVDAHLRQAQRSALHLEMRDGYMLDDPMLHAWRAGHRDDPDNRASWWNEWCEMIAGLTGRGVAVRRARIVSEPVSQYIRYEYDVTFMNLAVGEDVRWLPRRQATDLALPGNDFWLMDEQTLLINHFSGEGDWLEAELVSDPDVVKLCLSAFEAVWERATPHTEYRPR
ncbi:hypothetical protein CS0771_57250 [Catellatospora sp. IY07-71]|uniref:DUF6879 family protein n=1 Tax=Catellatospora sp. IY07-71 TaxID=2728827 RepID=UPI001BB7C5DA|nr:DUF6879 family protein [Catellatospora sp. IY07-71]BCJ76181.1 hypothetical protein CS0771_57250 [Catellatospora sp. IY07-71]